MKKNLRLIKLTIIALFLHMSVALNAQCPLNASFNVIQLGNGNVQFVSTSTGTTTQSTYQWYKNNSYFGSTTPIISNFINGTYTITLAVVNSFTPSLCSHTVSQVITVTSNTCNLVPSFTQTVTANSASFVSTSVGTVVGSTYTWHYGDATQGSGNPTSHTYVNSPNVYNCYLVVNNGGGCVDSVSNPVTINVPCALNANFVANQLGNGNVQFVSTSTGTTAQSYYQWYSNPSNFSSTAPTATANFINGTYTITLTVVNSFTPSLCSNTVSQIVTVTSNTCNLVPSFVHTVVANNATLQSTSAGTVAGSIYTWHYGDATQGSGNPTTHTYPNSPGGYNCYLVVDNGGGCIDSVSNWVTVSVPCNLNASFVANQLGNGNVQFVSTSTGTVANTSYQWYYNNIPFGSTNPINHNFANGTYTIKFAAVNSFTPSLCSQTITQIVTVNSNTCNLNAAFNFTQGTNGLVNFASVSTGTIPGMTYVWDFGDGFNTTGGPIVSHTYTNAGIHQAALLVQDPNNLICKDSVIVPINITSVPCVANSNFTLTQLGPGYWQAIPQYPYNVSVVTWSWGDNTFDNYLYASHTYSPIGLYNICLTVSVSCGATSSTCATYNITRLSSPMSMAYVNVVPPQSITLGIPSFSKSNDSNVLIYPNPTAGEFAILINNLKDNHAFIEVYTMTGKLVHVSYSDVINGQLNHEIKLKEEAEGVYLVKIKLDQSVITKKVVLQK